MKNEGKKYCKLFFKKISLVTVICFLVQLIPSIYAEQSMNTGQITANILQTSFSITVTGKIHIGGSQTVTLVILKPGVLVETVNKHTIGTNNVKYLVQTTISDDDGQYSFNYTMTESDSSGIYTVRIGSTNVDQPLVTSFDYVSKTQRDNAVNAINNTGSTAEMKAIIDGTNNDINLTKALQAMRLYLSEYGLLTLQAQGIICQKLFDNKKLPDNIYTEDLLKRVFNELVAVQSVKTADLQHFESKLFQYNDMLQLQLNAQSNYGQLVSNGHLSKVYGLLQQADYESVAELNNEFNKAVVLSLINSTIGQSTIGIILSANNDILKLPLTGEYALLDGDDKATVHKALIGKEFKHVNEVKSEFLSVLASVAKREDSGTGRNSAGGGKRETNITLTTLPTLPTLPTLLPSTQNIQLTFSDLEGVEWARESIEFLASKGIVNGMGNSEFKPNSKINREQFLKMLIVGFDMIDNTANCSFNDVDKNAWYYLYISSAVQSGIAQGLGNNIFGIGRDITRQEAAALIYRLVKSKNLILPVKNETVQFEDDQEIESYAAEGIKAMQQAGVLNGIGYGRFAPKEACTRAEAAKIIYQLIQLQSN